MLLMTALLVTMLAAAVMVGSVMLAMSWRDAGDRDAEALLTEQRIADNIVALTYEQQLAVYRYLQHGDTSVVRVFRARGDSAYRELHDYLFQSLPIDTRNRVESIKEAHQTFEVSAERSFQLDPFGRTDDARLRLADLDAHVRRLGGVVEKFLAARSRHSIALHQRQQVLGDRLRVALAWFAIALIALGYGLAVMLRRRVLRPLDDLAAAAKKLGDGDGGARVPPQPYEEFNVVGTAFNHMADRVRTASDETRVQNEELREALAHLHATQEELVQHEKLSAMGQMLAGLAHELNNPLAGILGMAEGLRADLAESSHADARAMGLTLAVPLEREALRANALVRSLLTFSRKPSGLLTPVRLSEAVSTAVGLRAHAFAQTGKALIVGVPTELFVMADAQKLQHAIVNVINNALDAIVETKGTRLEIHAAAVGNDLVRVDFDDDGTGFNDVRTAFRPFFTTKESGKGTGLGLVLVQRFVNEFGGTATARNRDVGGAQITLHLRSAAVETIASEIPPEQAPTRADAPGTNGGGQRVLVVDDEPSIRAVMRRLLTRHGLDVVLASSGAQARDIMLAERIDLVVSDLRMPGEMDGYALFSWMERERPALAATALLSTGDMMGGGHAPLPVPAERILSKPFIGTEVVHRIRRALGIPDV
jgi:C4-dicarboxylate-specific signal transduction histidine kinase/CheY-like chemotaxis protein